MGRQSLLCCLLLVATGCSSPPQPPVKLSPVRGKVVYRDGRSVEPLERGQVLFESKSDPALTAMGRI